MTRRQMVGLWGATAVQRAMAQSPLKFRGLDHIEFTVKDVEKSTAFYARLFGGAEVMKNRTTTRRYIKLGKSYMAIDRADTPRIDHVCLGVENFDIAAVHAYLTAKGLPYRDYPSGRDTGVNDPDGTRLQLAAAEGWIALAVQTASPEPRDVPAVFQPIDLSVVEINVNDFHESRGHYESLMGPSPSREYSVGLGRLDVFDGDPGFRRFRIQVRNFDFDSVRRTLNALGARPDDTAGVGLRFLDPDGFHVEVAGPTPRRAIA
jgi:catechol 2,3-dioxygenase-like lactoylglutathione lyase family enzyme